MSSNDILSIITILFDLGIYILVITRYPFGFVVVNIPFQQRNFVLLMNILEHGLLMLVLLQRTTRLLGIRMHI